MQLTERFYDSIVYALQLHSKQYRKVVGGVPYASHLLGVASIVMDYGGDEEEAIGALLHDSVEDQNVTVSDIEKRFGRRVAMIVEGCTDTDQKPKPPWLERKSRYIAHLRAGVPPEVRLVSMADKLHNARSTLANLRSMGDAIWENFKGGKEGTLWYLRSLVNTYRASGSDPLLDELDRTVTEIENLSGAKPELQREHLH
jgi:(p)ppGpp synthase/HD superfamily hydrolase